MSDSQHSFGRQLTLIVLAMVTFLAIGTGVASIVTYKPYGVADDRREEYEQILRDLAEQNRLRKEVSSDAVAVFDEREFDFGIIDPRTVAAEHDFIVTNQGKSDLLLEAIGSSCKCTVAKLEKPIVKPGESAKVKLIWNTGSDQTEVFEQTASLRTNDPQRKEIKLTVRGTVAAQWSFAKEIRPEKKAVLGQPLKGSTTLCSRFYDHMVVLETETSNPDLHLEVEPAEADELLLHQAKCGVKIVATYTPTDDREKVQEVVRCRVFDPNTGNESWVETEFKATYSQPVGFYGSEIDSFSGLDVGVVAIGSDQQWSVLVKFLTEETPTDPAVLRVEPASIQATLTPLTKIHNGYRLTMRLADDAVPTRFRIDRQGFVEVGDRNQLARSNWLPLTGEIIEPAEN